MEPPREKHLGSVRSQVGARKSASLADMYSARAPGGPLTIYVTLLLSAKEAAVKTTAERRRAYTLANSAAAIRLAIKATLVTGPTPPGTGVISPAMSDALS